MAFVNEKSVHLLSSGLDSPVAAYMLMTASIEPVFLFFDADPYNTPKTRDAAVKLATRLATLGKKKLKMYICKHGDTIDAFQAAAKGDEIKYTCVFCKRIYYLVAKELALRVGAAAISSGEIIGEQASQTLDNLATIQHAIGNFLILRPLLCHDKEDVVRIAREIGTYEISTEAKDPCLAVPRFPKTRSKIEAIEAIEARLDRALLIKKAIENAALLEVIPDE